MLEAQELLSDTSLAAAACLIRERCSSAILASAGGVEGIDEIDQDQSDRDPW